MTRAASIIPASAAQMIDAGKNRPDLAMLIEQSMSG